MISYRISDGNRLVCVENPDGAAWVDVVEPTKEELARIGAEFRINSDHLLDIMDIDEQARIEREEEYTLVICRLPVFDVRFEVSHFTVPCGALVFPGKIVTICQADNEVLEEIRTGRVRGIDPAGAGAFILHLFGRAAIIYLRYLKDINRRTSVIESELQRSVKNHELTQLLSIEKSLVYFMTSIKSNEILLEKFPSSRVIKFTAAEIELLEDVVTDNKQAIEMSGIYSDILSGMMDAFASVISNNLNIVMKRLTVVSVVIMIPTFVVSMFGMNVRIPLGEHPWAFGIILGTCVLLMLTGMFLLRDRPAPRKKRLAMTSVGGIALGTAKLRR